jgi:hypothetical protein
MSKPFTLRVFVPSGNPEATRIITNMKPPSQLREM